MARVQERLLISPFFVFFLITSMQIGVGILGFQRIIAKSAGYDSWIGIIIIGAAVHLVVWMIYGILGKSEGDIIFVHAEVFGKWIGGIISVVFISYLLAMAITVLTSYIEVIQVWMFPEFNRWIFTIFILLLVYYIVSGGFRTVTGISFFSIALPSYLLLVLAFPLQYAQVRNLLPLVNHTIGEIALAAKDMGLSVIGFEVILMYYPFIKEPQKSKKWAHLGVLCSTLLYLVLALITFMFYSEKQLEKQVWATLSMFKIVVMPFVERFEYIGITSWMLVILPNICLSLWAASRGMKRLFGIRQKKALLGIMVLVLFATGYLKTRQNIDTLSNYMALFGFNFVFLYIPFLYLLARILRKWRDKE